MSEQGTPFKTRPRTVYAIQWDGSIASGMRCYDFCGQNGEPVYAMMSIVNGRACFDPNLGVPMLKIKTLQGETWASPNDWIVRDSRGAFYPCKPDIFETNYEPETVAVDGGTNG